MTPVRHVSDGERRARLAVRHALAPAARVDSPEAATRPMTVLHATEPVTVHLSCWARTRSTTVADVDRALYGERSLVKQLAMRRALFVCSFAALCGVSPVEASSGTSQRRRLNRGGDRQANGQRRPAPGRPVPASTGTPPAETGRGPRTRRTPTGPAAAHTSAASPLPTRDEPSPAPTPAGQRSPAPTALREVKMTDLRPLLHPDHPANLWSGGPDFEEHYRSTSRRAPTNCAL